MDWPTKDNKTKRQIDKDYVSCEEEYEIEYLAKKYNVTKEIIKQCCQEIEAPHSRKKIEECINLQRDLELVYKILN